MTTRFDVRHLLSQAALFGVAASVMWSLMRLLDDKGSYSVVVMLLAGTHFAMAWAATRRFWPIYTAAVAAVGLCTIAVIALGDTTMGPLPTLDTLELAQTQLQTAFGPFDTIVAPVDTLPGFELALYLLALLLGLFSPLALARGRAAMAAVTPHAVLFAFGAILARGLEFASASLSVVLAALAYTVVIAAARSKASPKRLTASGLVLCGACVGLVALSLPAISDFEGSGLIDPRNPWGHGGPKEIESPIASVRNQLQELSDVVMFSVTAEENHYWRQTSLEVFDGLDWTSESTYESVESNGQLQLGDAPDVQTPTERVEVELAAYNREWIPLPYRTLSIDEASFDLTYHAESGSVLAADPDDVRRGAVIKASVTPPAVSADDLNGAGVSNPNEVYRSGGFEEYSPLAKTIAEEFKTEHAGKPYDTVLALQEYFRNGSFRYDASADYSGADDPTTQFLNDRVGFCQQFAATFAEMARWIGIPTRLATGYTFGDADPNDPTRQLIRGRNAHVWPEVYFEDFGWLTFEPTPSRGNPDAAPYTGVEAENEPEPEVAPTTTDVAAATTLAPPTTVTLTTPTTVPNIDVVEDGPVGSETNWRSWLALPILLAVAGFLAFLIRNARTAAQLGAGSTPSERVAFYWSRVSAKLRTLGIERSSSDTPVEFAQRASELTDVMSLSELGWAESRRRWDQAGASEQDAAWAERAEIDLDDYLLEAAKK